MQTEAGILEKLVELTQDSVNGYREGAGLVLVQDKHLAFLFEERARKRREILERLRTRLRAIDPKHGALQSKGTAAGHLHQTFMHFRAAFQDDRKAALKEIDRGESILVRAYEEALQDAPAELRPILQDALDSIRADESTVERIAENA